MSCVMNSLHSKIDDLFNSLLLTSRDILQKRHLKFDPKNSILIR